MDAAIAGYLREAVDASDITYRELAARTGISLNRIGIILRQEPPPATIGEMGLIAGALGFTALELIARAEEDLRNATAASAATDELAAARRRRAEERDAQRRAAKPSYDHDGAEDSGPDYDGDPGPETDEPA